MQNEQVGTGALRTNTMSNDNLIGLTKSRRIANTLESDIRSGRVSRGDLLESENSLMQRFSVSRNTVRKGLDVLARQGLITTRNGIGSFVTYNDQTQDSDLGWTLALAKEGVHLTTHTLAIKRDPCSLSSRFLKVKNDFLHIDRVRVDTRTHKGVSHERSRLPWSPCYSKVLDQGLCENSLSKTLLALGITVSSGEEWADVLCQIPARIAKQMNRDVDEAMLKLRRVTRSSDEQVVEYVNSVLDPLHFGLHLRF